MGISKILELKCCEYNEHSPNSQQTVREWIHETFKYVYTEDILDEDLNKMTDTDLNTFIDELDWSSWK